MNVCQIQGLVHNLNSIHKLKPKILHHKTSWKSSQCQLQNLTKKNSSFP
jgi:hypothetical protein